MPDYVPAGAQHRVNAELVWVDGKVTQNVLQSDSVEHAEMLRMNNPQIKVGFLENRPLTPLGMPIPMWLDIDSDKITAIREVHV